MLLRFVTVIAKVKSYLSFLSSTERFTSDENPTTVFAILTWTYDNLFLGTSYQTFVFFDIAHNLQTDNNSQKF